MNKNQMTKDEECRVELAQTIGVRASTLDEAAYGTRAILNRWADEAHSRAMELQIQSERMEKVTDVFLVGYGETFAKYAGEAVAWNCGDGFDTIQELISGMEESEIFYFYGIWDRREQGKGVWISCETLNQKIQREREEEEE